MYAQAVEFRTNVKEHDVTGRVVVNFLGPQNDMVDTKTIWRDIMFFGISSKFHSLLMLKKRIYWCICCKGEF